MKPNAINKALLLVFVITITCIGIFARFRETSTSPSITEIREISFKEQSAKLTDVIPRVPLDLSKVAGELEASGNNKLAMRMNDYENILGEFDEIQVEVRSLQSEIAERLAKGEESGPDTEHLQAVLEDRLQDMHEKNILIARQAKELTSDYLDYAMRKYGISRGDN